MSFPSTSNTDTIANLPSGLWGKARPVVGPTIGVDGPEPLAINWCAGGGCRCLSVCSLLLLERPRSPASSAEQH